MWKKILVTALVTLALTALGILVPGVDSEAEAVCVHCFNGQCEGGGDGVWCRETHWPNGSSVCEYVDGCTP